MEALLACSGLGAPAAIGESIRIGYRHAVVVGIFLVLSLALAGFARRWVVPAILLGLLALHPAWTISAISGDCGYFKRDTSQLFTGLGGAAFLWQAARTAWSGRKRNPPEPQLGDPADAGRLARVWSHELGGLPVWLVVLIMVGVLIPGLLLLDAMSN